MRSLSSDNIIEDSVECGDHRQLNRYDNDYQIMQQALLGIRILPYRNLNRALPALVAGGAGGEGGGADAVELVAFGGAAVGDLADAHPNHAHGAVQALAGPYGAIGGGVEEVAGGEVDAHRAVARLGAGGAVVGAGAGADVGGADAVPGGVAYLGSGAVQARLGDGGADGAGEAGAHGAHGAGGGADAGGRAAGLGPPPAGLRRLRVVGARRGGAGAHGGGGRGGGAARRLRGGAGGVVSVSKGKREKSKES